MTEEFQILNLSSNLTDDIEALNLLPVQDFDGNFVLGDQVLANLDFSKGPIWWRKKKKKKFFIIYLRRNFLSQLNSLPSVRPSV